MRAGLESAAVRESRFWSPRVPNAFDGTLALDLARLHDPVSIAGWALAVIGGLTIWTVLFATI